MSRYDDVNIATCDKCDGAITQFDTDGGLWVGEVENGGNYDCPLGGLHVPRYPRRIHDGRTVWACCVSSIGPTCQHVAVEAQR